MRTHTHTSHISHYLGLCEKSLAVQTPTQGDVAILEGSCGLGVDGVQDVAS